MVLSQTFHGGLGVAIATGMMTVLVLVFAEVLPKTLAIMRADDVARWLSGPTELAVLLFAPVVNTVQWFVGGTLEAGRRRRRGGARRDRGARGDSRGAVEYHHSEGMVESADRRMLGARARPWRDGRGRRHGAPPSIDMLDADLAAARGDQPGAEALPHAPADLPRRAGEHHRRAARPRPARGRGDARGGVRGARHRRARARALVHPRDHEAEGSDERVSPPARPISRWWSTSTARCRGW